MCWNFFLELILFLLLFPFPTRQEPHRLCQFGGVEKFFPLLAARACPGPPASSASSSSSSSSSCSSSFSSSTFSSSSRSPSPSKHLSRASDFSSSGRVRAVPSAAPPRPSCQCMAVEGPWDLPRPASPFLFAAAEAMRGRPTAKAVDQTNNCSPPSRAHAHTQ
eukprot:GHVT01076101.1.p2 GENE.GHVT01076101.1~~GHVT01076101.1.p2  ORF type:complete len:163 (+),score=45.69 GHVT01076101.1:188-676(+)